MKKNCLGILITSGAIGTLGFFGSVCMAQEASYSPASEDHQKYFQDSERRAVAVSNWWKHKFKDDPAFNQTALTPAVGGLMPAVGGPMPAPGGPIPSAILRQHAIEEESR